MPTLFSVRWSWKPILAAALCAGLSAAAAAQVAAAAGHSPTPAATPAAPAARPAVTPAASGDYQLGPDDVIDIEVWGEPNISGKIPVRPDGKISVPLVGELQAAGKTPLQLQSMITEKLSATIDDPAVTVVVEQVNSRRINVLGQVLHPGTFPLSTEMHVLDALAMAGGPVPFAHLNRIYVLRTVNGQAKRFPFDYKKVIGGHAEQENLVLLPGDTIVVP